jgi:hypothetical protein
MNLTRRLLMGCPLLGAGLLIHWALLWQLAPIRNAARLGLRANLASLPIEFHIPESSRANAIPETFRAWRGSEHPGQAELAKQASFADDLLLRIYSPDDLDPKAMIYAVFSRTAEDRKHHPEICVRDIQGSPEDIDRRKTIHLNEDQGRPVQRFRFQTGTDSYTMVYYWHYALTPPLSGELSHLQQIHLRNLPKCPSVTVQVTTTAAIGDLDALESSLLVAVDRELRESVLPPSVTMSCDLLAIALWRQ